MKKSVFVAVPIHRQWSHESKQFFLKNVEAARYWRVSELSQLYEESLIVRARETLMDNFLASKAEYLFFLDDDIVLFQDNAIDNLVTADKDIIGAAYICKKPPHNPTFLPFDQSHYPDIRGWTDPFEVQRTGTGCLLITRAVCEKLKKEYHHPFNLIEHGADHFLMSEDYSFCIRAREHGFRIWIDPRVLVGHLGTYAYGMSDFYNFVEYNKNQGKDIYAR